MKVFALVFVFIAIVVFLIFSLLSEIGQREIAEKKAADYEYNYIAALNEEEELIAIARTSGVDESVIREYSQRLSNALSTEHTGRKEAEGKATVLESQVSSLGQDVESLESDLARKHTELQAINTELTAKQAELGSVKSDLESTKGELQSTNNELTRLQTEVEKKISDVENRIWSLEQWTSDNSMLSTSISSSLHSMCEVPVSSCVVDAQKIGRSMNTCGGFRYENDVITTGKGDDLFTINDFWNGKVGDCDDYALFVAGWVRSEIKNKRGDCPKVDVKISNEKTIDGPVDVYTICGYSKKLNSGHCEVGIIQRGYNPFDDLAFYSMLDITEPQSGGYDNKATNAFSSVWGLFSDDTYYIVDPPSIIGNFDTQYSLKTLSEELR